MKIAFISDIHANIVALDAVLADIRRVQVDKTIFLGDAVTIGPQPKAVIERLSELNLPSVLGNHDAFVIAPARVPSLAWIGDWYARQMGEADIELLQSFKPNLEIQLDQKTWVFCFHGSPRDFTDQILAETPPDELDIMIEGCDQAILIGGHTHIQMMRQHNGQLIVNTGSVGMPFERVPFPEAGPTYLPWAEYAILRWDGGNFGVELRRVPYECDP